MSDPLLNDPSRSPSGFKLVTSAERLKVLSLAAPRFFAWVVDTAIFAALVFVLYHVDGVYLQGDLALNMVYEADRRLIEETQNSLDGDVEQTISIYEEDRLYENGTTVTWRVRVDHRVGQEPSGEPWELKLETKEFVEADGELPGKYGFAVLATFIMAPLPYRYFLESSPVRAEGDDLGSETPGPRQDPGTQPLALPFGADPLHRLFHGALHNAQADAARQADRDIGG